MDVRSAEIAQFLNVPKPSVTHMLTVLMEKNLIVKKRYGKIHFTEKGTALTDKIRRGISVIEKRIQCMDLLLTPEKVHETACAFIAVLPDSAVLMPEEPALQSRKNKGR
jgi:Mn-dependent DtxR family transcriptional regulator